MTSEIADQINFKGVHLIEASAGTGKTYTICNLVILLLLGRGKARSEPLAIDEILILTFTIAATDELKTRVRRRVLEAKRAFEIPSQDLFLRNLVEASSDKQRDKQLLVNALRMVDQASVYTIHGFCAKVLKEYPFECGSFFNQEVSDEKSRNVQTACEDFFRSNILLRSPSIQKLALSIWDTPKTLENSIATFLYRGELSVNPKKILGSETDIFNKAEKIKRTWIGDDLESVIAESGLRKNSKIKTNASAMTDFCRTDEIDLTSALWEIFTSDKIIKIKKDSSPLAHPIFRMIDELLLLIENYKVGLKIEAFEHIKGQVIISRSSSEFLGIDDLLPKVEDAILKKNSSLKKKLIEKWPVAMIDEFQDTDSVQWNIFHEIYGQKDSRASLLLIGDPKQAIYNFRGADIFTYLNAKNTATSTYSLSENWRSSKNYIDAINDLFKGKSIFGESAGIKYLPSSSPSERELPEVTWENEKTTAINIFVDEDQLSYKRASARNLINHAAFKAAEIIRGESLQIGGCSIKPSQIAFLVATRRDAEMVKKALEKFQIEAINLSNDSVFKQQTAHDLIQILGAIICSKNIGKLKAALSTSLIGSPPVEIEALDIENDSHRLSVIAEFQNYQRTWISDGFGRMVALLIEKRRLASNLLETAERKRQITDLRHLTELLQEREAVSPGTSELLAWLKSKYVNQDSFKNEKHALRPHTDEELVKILTMHSSKGLEFDIVFMPYPFKKKPKTNKKSLAFAHLPQDGVHKACLDFRSDSEIAALEEIEELDEEVRLLYVSLTRAKYRCYIGLPKVDQNMSKTAIARILSLRELKESDSLYQNLSSTLPSSIYQVEKITSKTIEEPLPQQSIFSPEPPAEKPDIKSTWKILSYSGMIKRAAEKNFDPRDFDDEGIETSIQIENQERSKHHFPKGIKTGLAMHSLLEKIDFEAPSHSAECRKLLSNLALEDSWLIVLEEWIDKILSTDLGPLKLKDLKNKDRVAELEFFFSLSKTEKMIQFLFEQGFISSRGQKDLHIEGFMTGIIDLVFRRDGKYYLLDYKSNFLGANDISYNTESLSHSMTRHDYHLQYLIYTVALHRMLKRDLTSYSYEENFGGVYYFFLRGVDCEKTNGVFFTRPDQVLIEKIDGYMSINNEK